MASHDVLIQVFGYTSLVAWAVMLLPQILLNYRTQSTDGLSRHMMAVWYISEVLLFAYGLAVMLPLSLLLQPVSFGLLNLVVWTQCYYYEPRSLRWSLGFFLGVVTLTVGVVTGLSFAFSAASNHNVAWVIDAMGVIPTVIAVLGYFPQYVELYKTRNPYGLSLLFLIIDLVGSGFAIAALCLTNEFLVVAALLYCSIALCSLILSTSVVTLRILRWRQAKTLAGASTSTIVLPPDENEMVEVKLEAV
jgi:uncharacterized protein with PQ loop repeat